MSAPGHTYPPPGSIEIWLRPPPHAPVHNHEGFGITIPEDTWMESLAELHRDHDAPFPFSLRNDQERIEHQKRMRIQMTRLIADRLANLIAPKILEAIEARDAKHGYWPEERT